MIDINVNYLERLAKADLDDGVYEEIHTRFPPEPNGYLHIGSAFAINTSYQMAKKLGGKFNLRFDDTNPKKEDYEYVNAIIEDMKWLGFDFEDRLFFGSDYSDQLFDYAVYLIKKGSAYVCDLSSGEIREYRGTLTSKGRNSPYRNRSIEENLDLFFKMKEGHFKEGERILRAKIDMESPNMSLRDPVIYRISYTPHYRTGTDWCIYPLYDYAHPIQDYIEGISHSLCSFEFINNKPLYDWVINELDLKPPLPKQIEFGRVNLTGVVTSKRHLRTLVEHKIVDGWDDPRLATLQGLRRRGYTKDAILKFLNEVGVSKGKSMIDFSMLEQTLRQDLKPKVPAIMSVLSPLKVVITNLPDDYKEYLDATNNPSNSELGSRRIPFTKTLFIERDDFSEHPPKKFKRLVQGKEVRLKHAYFIKCNEVIKDENGKVIELHCTYDKETKSGTGFTGRKVKGTIHWVSEDYGVKSEVRIYNDLFSDLPDSDNILDIINPNSVEINKAVIEPAILDFDHFTHFQFIRHGYFVKDSKLSVTNNDLLVFNRSVSLKSSYKKK
ncbi:glutamine--tRNA ligase/YqeY domain fusion protein [Haloplasma contractile]|uniref:Glutamine--tRNA ligase n=1 Tax=Haloplasma contractile SSD-17B TaxID=1033810 RepID=U2FQA3_9MOLU|nr:glutamine--tRNA ligase/YqeY domain fusion protein [Haloplasma contractile]ERJ13219.1 Glutamine--tRNA ligase protein [Haloplasma contractile SSD-17B]